MNAPKIQLSKESKISYLYMLSYLVCPVYMYLAGVQFWSRTYIPRRETKLFQDWVNVPGHAQWLVLVAEAEKKAFQIQVLHDKHKYVNWDISYDLSNFRKIK